MSNTPSQTTIRDEDVWEFRRLARGLDRLIGRIALYNPEANLYLACDTLNLMKGPSHVGFDAVAQQDNVVESVHIQRSGGGDW